MAGAAVPEDACAESGCAGFPSVAGRCLAHASPEALALSLSFTGLGVDLDGRGVRFTREVLERVLEAVPTDDSGRRLLGTLRFDRATFLAELPLDDTTFTGPLSMVETTFERDARFGGATFASSADFAKATFSSQAWFVGAAFDGPVSFRAAMFQGPAWFQRTAFARTAAFDNAVFVADATITKATFAEASSFRGSVFEAHARFDGSRTWGDWHFEGARFRRAGQGPPEDAASALVPDAAPAPALPLPPPLEAPPKPKRPGLGRRLRSLSLFSLLVVGIIIGGVLVARPDATKPTGFRDYAFLHRNERTDLPTRYNPCEPIRYVVNPEMSPPGGKEAIEQAVAEVSTATGITFESAGSTTESIELNLPLSQDQFFRLPVRTKEYAEELQEMVNRPSYQPERYGRDRWAPVLIAWTSFAELGLSDSSGILGFGASEPRDVDPSTTVYVSGVVVVNVAAPFRNLRATVQHELGHMVGLAHVNSPEEMMYGEENRQDDWGNGDREGLRRVGRPAGCLPTPPPG